MLKRDREKTMEKPPKLRILDWKLDFYDEEIGRLYFAKFSKGFLVPYVFALISIEVVFLITLLCIIFPFGVHSPLSRNAYLSIAPPMAAVLCAIFLIGFKYFRERSVQCCAVLALVLCLLLAGLKFERPFGNLGNPDAFMLQLLVFVLFITLRLPIKQGAPSLFTGAVAMLISNSLNFPLASRGYHLAVASVIINCFVVALFCGYYLEQRAKYDFLRTSIVEFESRKLLWAVDRDVSLLRNIFPKNLSDEIELQMSNKTQLMRTKSQIKRSRTAAFFDKLSSIVSPSAPSPPPPFPVYSLSSHPPIDPPNPMQKAASFVPPLNMAALHSVMHPPRKGSMSLSSDDTSSTPRITTSRFAPSGGSSPAGQVDSNPDSAKYASPRNVVPIYTRHTARRSSEYSPHPLSQSSTSPSSSPVSSNPPITSVSQSSMFDSSNSTITPNLSTSPPISPFVPSPLAGSPPVHHRISARMLPQPSPLAHSSHMQIAMDGPTSPSSSSFHAFNYSEPNTPHSPSTSPPNSQRVPTTMRLPHSSSNSSVSSSSSSGTTTSVVSTATNASGRKNLSVEIPQANHTPAFYLSPLSHASISPSSRSSVYSLPPVIFVPPSPSGASAGLARMPSRSLTSSGRPLHTHHGPELYTYFNGAQHVDGSLIALSHAYPDVSVVLADIVGFTSLSSTVSPQGLVNMLNTIFSLFDDIMENLQLEKVRTIGDAYLCVANMSIPIEDHEMHALEAASRMMHTIRRFDGLNLRIGVASGSLLAGITGITKWNYDIFGAPLADATLMETSSAPGSISISASIYYACNDNPEYKFERSDIMDGDVRVERYVAYSIIGYDQPSGVELTSINIEDSDFTHSTLSTERFDDLSLLSPFDSVNSPLFEDLELASVVSSGTDVPLTDFSTDSHRVFTFSKEELEAEVEHIDKYITHLKFLHPGLEQEYNSANNARTAPLMSRYLALIMFTVVMYALCDQLAVLPNLLSLKIFIFHTIKFVIVLSYWVSLRFWEKMTYRDTVCAMVLLAYGTITIMVCYYEPTILHLQRVVSVVFTLSVCMRRARGGIPVVLTLIAVISSIFIILNNSTYFPTTYLFLLDYYALACSLMAQIFLERSFRKEFIMQRLLDISAYQQKQAQHRAKLLLHNILPEEIIPRLHSSLSRGVVDLFEEATVMFVNITNLAELTTTLEASDAFNIFNEIFTQFDEATRAYGLEKIKTINTVYMVASGLPRKTKTHAEDAISLAIEFYRIVSTFSSPFLDQPIRLRVGVASGPVVAGIIGKKKYSYDCWSDTTNTASRMESNGWDGYLQATHQVQEAVQFKYPFTPRENVPIKGKGLMKTYMLNLATVAYM